MCIFLMITTVVIWLAIIKVKLVKYDSSAKYNTFFISEYKSQVYILKCAAYSPLVQQGCRELQAQTNCTLKAHILTTVHVTCGASYFQVTPCHAPYATNFALNLLLGSISDAERRKCSCQLGKIWRPITKYRLSTTT